ncbi:hypothetical protein [Desulfotomaculum sp. 1211_IL3151]|uniref:hypothetical protein n=1 Tax=Desulfotomaculum sp. 1211_IL3151 TaxID=3084055 RepID=UPI002FDA342C
MKNLPKGRGTIHKISYLFVIVNLLTFLLLPNLALASEVGPFRLAAQPGLSGIYKNGFATGITISVANQGQGCQGLLVIEPDKNSPGARDLSLRYHKTIDIPAKGLVKTTLMIPSEFMNRGAVAVLLVDEKVVAATPIQGTVVNGGFLALTLGEKPLRGGLATWLDQTFGGQTAIKYMKPAYLPNDAMELLQADIIIVDDVAVKELTEKQLTTLKDWVSLGGILLISDGAGTYAGEILADISPVRAEKQAVVTSDLGGLQVVNGNMTVTTGKLMNGEVLAQVKDTILVASRDLGKGRIIYSAIPLENLTSESARVWPLIFNMADGSNRVDVKVQMAREKRNMGNDMLVHASTYLPQIKTPPVPQVALAWGVYVIIIGPVLYLILKRRDRRDWMWWIIPICALVTTSVVYFMSPAQRINAPISQTLSLVEILDNQRAEINATASFVSPFGGDLKVEGNKEAVILPTNFYGNSQKSPSIGYHMQAAPVITFPGVEYWSMRQAKATAFKKDMGSIEGNLTLENGYITGKIENKTGLDLRDCRIILGGRSLTLESIPAGGFVTVKQSLSKWPNSLGPNEFRDLLVAPSKPGQEDNFIRERQMVDAIPGFSTAGSNNQPVFYGWSEESLGMFKIVTEKENAKDYHLTLVTQQLKLNISEEGNIQLPAGMYRPKMIESRGAYNETPLGFTLYEGKIVLGIDLVWPLNEQKLQVLEIVWPEQTNKNLVTKIYDQQNNQWVDVPSQGLRLTADQVAHYTASGQVRVQVEKISGLGQPDRVELPAISVKGGESR